MLKTFVWCLIPSLLFFACASETPATRTDLGNADSGVDLPTNNTNNDDVGSDLSQDVVEDMTEDMPLGLVDEQEPNDGTTLDEFNPVNVPGQITGTITEGDPADVFRIETVPGRVYIVQLLLPDGSTLQPHLAIFDDGRDGENASEDYIKIVEGAGSGSFIAMGEGGYFLAVRDLVEVQGGDGGGPNHTYSLRVVELEASAFTRGEFELGDELSGALATPSDLDLYAFTGVEGRDVLFDFAASGDVDGRLFVFSVTVGSWVARQDNRSANDVNPLLDAPLLASGEMFLVVENITPTASDLGYTIQTSE